MSFIDRINEVNRALPNRDYYRLYVNHNALGFVDRQILAELPAELFSIDSKRQRVDCGFDSEQRQDFEKAMDAFFRAYFKKHQLSGWRDEKHAVKTVFASDALFLIERAALSFLGITGYGIHVNGYVKKASELFMWIAKRSANKPTAAGKLDQIVAGGLPYGLLPKQNVIKECQEEASIPRHLAKTATAVSAISYAYDLPIGLRPDVIFNYDLLLPESFVPRVNDQEVESFQLLPLAEILEIVKNTQQFKFNCAVVIIDFAMRHGVIDPEHPDYLALQSGMNRGTQRLLK